MKKAVFLDRDGVINPVVIKNGKPHPPLPQDYQIYSNAPEALNRLKNHGFMIFIFTNQPDISNKLITEEQLNKIHQKVSETLPIDEIVTCIHLEVDQCLCRKPKAGMLLYLQKKWDLDFTQSFVVGDRWRDIEAGQAVNCRTILIGDGYNEKKISADWCVKDINEMTEIVLKN